MTVPPQPQGRVSDYAGLLDASGRARIEERLRGIEERTSNQFVVAIFRSLDGESLEDFSIRLAEAWRVGQGGRDNGLILLIFAEDRKVRIEVGYGLEGTITDALAGRVIRNVLAPRFRKGDYAGGILDAVNALDAASRGEFEAFPKARRRGVPLAGFLPFLLVFFFILFRVLRNRPTHLGGRGVRRGGWWVGPWGGGVGRGGFGGGGFSGGGGGFGGGGASGGW